MHHVHRGTSSRSVYFVGAGITRSLETSRPIPLMNDFVHVAAHYADEEYLILTFLVALDRTVAAYRQPTRSTLSFALAAATICHCMLLRASSAARCAY